MDERKTRALSEAEVTARVAILWNLDDQSCEACLTPCPDGIASDPAWFIDTEVEDGVEYAVIRCPECW